MDVTPQVINEVEFHQKMRGYDPDEVDDFLERVAVGRRPAHRSAARGRSARRDRRSPSASSSNARCASWATVRPRATSDETETIKRTLVLAQKTADAAVKEAKEEAQRTVADAQQHADTLLSDAQETSQRLVSEAEIEARKTSEETRQRMADEIVALEEARDALKADHGILERHLDEQRLRLRSSIGDCSVCSTTPRSCGPPALPELSGATRRRSPTDDTAASRPAATATTSIDLAPRPASDRRRRRRHRRPTSDDVPVERPITGGVRFSPPEDGQRRHARRTARRTAARHRRGRWRHRRLVALRARRDARRSRRPRSAMPAGEDAYLVELRKAMIDDAGADAARRRSAPRSDSRFGRRR